MAHNVTVEFDPMFNMWTYLDDVKFWRRNPVEFKVIAPEQKFETFVEIRNELHKSYYELVDLNSNNAGALDTTLIVSYFDEEGNKFKSTYNVSLLDFESHRGRVTYDMTNLVNEIIETKRILKDISIKK